MLVFRCVHVAAELVGGKPEFGFKTKLSGRVGGAVRGARMGHIAPSLLLGSRGKASLIKSLGDVSPRRKMTVNRVVVRG